MAEWEKQIGAVNLIVGDLERSKTFYREVFDLAPLHEEEHSAVFRFKDTYVMLQHCRSLEEGVGQFAIIVDDVDAVHTELDRRGVTVISGPADRDWGMRTLTFADPDGCIWEIAQALPGAPGSS